VRHRETSVGHVEALSLDRLRTVSTGPRLGFDNVVPRTPRSESRQVARWAKGFSGAGGLRRRRSFFFAFASGRLFVRYRQLKVHLPSFGTLSVIGDPTAYGRFKFEALDRQLLCMIARRLAICRLCPSLCSAAYPRKIRLQGRAAFEMKVELLIPIAAKPTAYLIQVGKFTGPGVDRRVQ
jgi:hypothetical protein